MNKDMQREGSSLSLHVLVHLSLSPFFPTSGIVMGRRYNYREPLIIDNTVLLIILSP
jgi:hypothetical protein